MAKREFTLEDFMAQMEQIKKLGSMSKIMGMIPGMSRLVSEMNMGEGEIEKQMDHMRAIYDSMNKKERLKPDLLDGHRRHRVARGAGVPPNEVGSFLKQYNMLKETMKSVSGMGMGGRSS
ncbi:MAG TPA: hypothetical protein VH370_19890 [Humisphaera sp.]|jgi:signal recognition particle subunit SRP54|nr:hypothetical protein [Humisphaera sp.]